MHQPERSNCTPAITAEAAGAYGWGTAGATSTNQVFKRTAQMTVTGLPADAVITKLSVEIASANRDESVPQYYNTPTSFDPGHRSTQTRTQGICTTNYAQITGCDFTNQFQAVTGAVNTTATSRTLYRTSTPGRAREPGNGSTATIKLVETWTPRTWGDGQTRTSYTIRYEGDPRIANEMLTTDANGCKTFASLDVPICEQRYSNVVGPDHVPDAQIMIWDLYYWFEYTSGGRTDTASVHNVSRQGMT